MPQTTVNSINIDQFGWSAVFDPALQTITFDTAALTTYNNPSGTGALYVLGIAFSVVDQQGVILAGGDWDNPQIQPALGETEWTLDLSSIGIDFFFQTYKIIGYIKDADGQVYSTTAIYPKICQPVGITSGGYVDGIFQVLANCPDNVLTVKEVTPFVYNNLTPQLIGKSGNLYYPTGTISAIPFTNTPFTNNELYTGQYRIVCTTVANYDLGNDVSVDITYYTNNVFDLTCSNKVQDILCCIVDIQRTKTANCNNAVGERAAQLEAQITVPFLVALSKEISGQDASAEVAFIRKILNCNCGATSIIRNEFSPLNNEPNPIDPTVTTILIQGSGGTTVAAPSVSGNTKTFTINSKVYQVVKDDSLDTSFSITVDTNTINTVKYKIAFNYAALSQTILTTIGGNTSLLAQFNSLVNITNFNIDLSNLDGKCIIDLSANGKFLSQKVPSGASQILNIIINGTTYNATAGAIVLSDTAAIELWLNSLGLGTFSVSFSNAASGAYINILTTGNSNTVTSCYFGISSTLPGDPDSFVTAYFQNVSTSLIGFLQAVVDYICSLSALEVALGQNQSFSYVDYNGNTVTYNLSSTDTQAAFNTIIANVISTMQALNITFRNGITNTAGIVRLGGDLEQFTRVTYNGFVLQFFKDALHYITFSELITYFYYGAGTAGTDKIMRLAVDQNEMLAIAATNNDIIAGSYYAPAFLQVSATNELATIGAFYPVPDTLPVDPYKTAFITPSEGRIDYYAKDHVVEGAKMSLGTLLKLKNMTTAERDAIDVSLLEAGLVIFNSTTSQFQGYDGSTWNILG